MEASSAIRNRHDREATTITIVFLPAICFDKLSKHIIAFYMTNLLHIAHSAYRVYKKKQEDFKVSFFFQKSQNYIYVKTF